MAVLNNQPMKRSVLVVSTLVAVSFVISVVLISVVGASALSLMSAKHQTACGEMCHQDIATAVYFVWNEFDCDDQDGASTASAPNVHASANPNLVPATPTTPTGTSCSDELNSVNTGPRFDSVSYNKKTGEVAVMLDVTYAGGASTATVTVTLTKDGQIEGLK
jgi:hypothetical protein